MPEYPIGSTRPGTYDQVPTSGTLAARPATPIKGQQYLATDTAGGTLYESLVAGAWTQMAGGVSQSSAQINAFTRTRYYSDDNNTGNALGAMYRVRHRALTGGYGMILRFGNIGGNSSVAEASLGNTITVKAAVEDSAGNIFPVYFRGSRSVTFDPNGSVVDSEPVGVDWVAGAIYFGRYLVTVPATTNAWPQSSVLLRQQLGDGFEIGTTIANPTDKTDSGTITAVANDTTYAFGPLEIRSAKPVANPNVLALLGDSIEQGTGDQIYSAGGAGDLGYVERALYRTNAPAIDLARFGEQLAGFATANLRAHRFKLLGNATHVLVELGINDLVGSATLAQMQSRALVIATLIANRGARAYFTTVTPKTTSTDEFRTTANQTLALANEATARTPYNDWLRAGAPIDPTTLAAVAVGTSGALLAGAVGHPMTGYFEAADQVESARNSGKWLPFRTLDGLHPDTLGHRALAAAVDTTIFGFAAQPAAVAFPVIGVIPGLRFRYNFAAPLDLANGAVVSTVADLGPNGWTLTSTSTGADPIQGRNRYIGNSGVEFANAKYLQNVSVAVAQPDTIVAIAMPTLTGSGQPFDGITTRQRLNLGSSTTGSNGDIYAGSFVAPLPYPYSPATAPIMVAAVFNGASSKVSINGGTVTTGNAGANNLGGLKVGSGMTGGLLELFAFDHDVLAVPSEVAALNAYAAYAYDLRIAGQPQVF